MTVHTKSDLVNCMIRGYLNKIFIDPLLSGLHRSVLAKIMPSQKVIDIACGIGSLAMAISKNAVSVKGIDISDEMIAYAARSARKKGITNAEFEVHDASDLSDFRDDEFDIAITSMAVHQFEAGLAIKILSEMKRIALKVIIADYNCLMTKNFSRTVAISIEKFAAGEHYRNFRNYMEKGGIKYFTDKAGLVIRSEKIKSNGVLMIVECE